MSHFNNRGILFRNFRKQQPKHPDVTGEAIIDGRKYRIAGWKKAGRRGEFHSLAFTMETPPAEPASAVPSTTTEEPVVPASLEGNDIPF